MEKISDAMKKCSDKMFEIAGDQNISEENMKKAVQEESRATIDTALGEGAFDRIFAEEEADIVNLVSLVDFIAEEINLWKTELAAKGMAGKAMLEKR